MDKKKVKTVYKEKISTQSMNDIVLNIKCTGSIEITNGKHPFKGGIEGFTYPDLPYKFNNLVLGNYHLKVFLDDPAWRRKIYFFNRFIRLKPGENRKIDFSNLKFKNLWGLSFIPGAAQIYTRQYIKAGLIIPFFIISALTATLSYTFTNLYYTYSYSIKADIFNTSIDGGGYTEEDIDRAYNNIDYIQYGFLIGGVISTVAFYLFSVIDGTININRINNLLNGKIRKKKRNKVKFSFSII